MPDEPEGASVVPPRGQKAVAKLGEIFHAGDKKAQNDWKTRMLKAGLGNKGLIMPDDWNELSEAEKEARLNRVIQSIS